MRHSFFTLLAGTAIVSSGVATPAMATVIVSLPGGTSIPIPGLNIITNASAAIGGGINFVSDVPGGSIFGGTSAITFGNGSFEAGNPYLALNAPANGYNYATMSITFDTPTSGVLADIRWTDGGPEIGNLAYNSAGMAIYGSKDAALGDYLEFYQFNNNGRSIGRSPGYYGFSRPTADIARISFFNAYMGVRDLQYIGPSIGTSGAVPEPATWALMIFGFGTVGFALRRRRGAIRRAASLA